MKAAAALLAGLVFGVGLALSGMLNPARVLGFLDLAGAWDPRLAFVLAGAVAVSAVSYALARHRPRPLLASRFDIPTSRRIDARLLLGAALFGIGWGMAGFCPGPAFASLAFGIGKSVLFVVAMLAGMALFRLVPPPRP
ncbi:MAG: YeeE/YedE family protein [Rhodospirillales bacterium]|nr:YeeE/YedE family protein [Rhodospirillales bacterium]MBN8905271.1 YeeE/YedE family protein [Rhodospirillales bacterium]